MKVQTVLRQNQMKAVTTVLYFRIRHKENFTVDEVTGLGGDVAQDAINEIYARHGYVFKTKSIQKYYESRSWYHKNYNFSESDLSEIESYNIGLLRKYN